MSRWRAASLSVASLLLTGATVCWFLPPVAVVPTRLALGALGLLAAWRWAKQRRVGLPLSTTLGVIAGAWLFAALWTFGHQPLFIVAERMRAMLPVAPEHWMRALPGNDPGWAVRLLHGEAWRDGWTALYLTAWQSVPLLALSAWVVLGRRTAALRIAWSHATTTLLALPIFVLLPIPDPWFDVGWFGAVAPPWWAGLAHQVVTCAFPSLHVAVAVVVALAAGAATSSRWLRAAWWMWVTLIAMSTLALYTHWLIDLPAGAALGYATHRLTGCALWHWRRWRRWLRQRCQFNVGCANAPDTANPG